MLEYFNPRVAYESLQAFLASGGPVLVAIMVLTFVMWGLIIERLLYWSGAHAGVAKRAKRAWEARSDHDSYFALA
ncbi:MAG TPA: MotA/TolQ/ExbB proton channel family protein, partial [Amphiplicatus sp.]|nr:MotA/TolQ/ExbB proton channel family protein [Amphiplicatus sp.]